MSPAPNISKRGVPSAVGRVLHSGRVWIIQGAGTLVWLALAYGCFRSGKTSGWRLAGSVLLAIVLAYLAAFLQRTALRVYRRERLDEGRLGGSVDKAGRREFFEWLPRAAFVAVLFAVLAWLYVAIWARLPGALKDAASWLTVRLGRPVDFNVLEARAVSLEFVIAWMLFVLFWLPLAAGALLGEGSMWRAAVRAWRRLRYWLGTLACFVVGRFVLWELSGLGLRVGRGVPRTAGVYARLALGYSIALGAWLVILALAEESISSARPRSPDDTWD